MRFLVDAQLPPSLVVRLRDFAHDALHTRELPRGNRTTDREIAALADAEGWVVVTKDADFVESQIVFGSPRKLLVIETGNMRNGALVALFDAHHDAIVRAVARGCRVALTGRGLVVQRDD